MSCHVPFRFSIFSLLSYWVHLTLKKRRAPLMMTRNKTPGWDASWRDWPRLKRRGCLWPLLKRDTNCTRCSYWKATWQRGEARQVNTRKELQASNLEVLVYRTFFKITTLGSWSVGRLWSVYWNSSTLLFRRMLQFKKNEDSKLLRVTLRILIISGGAQVITCEDQSSKRIPKKYIVEVDDCLPECCMFSMSSRLHFRWLKFRCSIRCLVEHKYFEWFILFTVMFSSFVLVRKNTSVIWALNINLIERVIFICRRRF